MTYQALSTWVQAAPEAAATPETVEMDPLALILNASGPVFFVVWSLILAAVVVWFVAILKMMQLRRWSKAERLFELDAAAAEDAEHLFDIARHHEDAPGARVVIALRRRVQHGAEMLEAVAKRAVVDEEQRASTLMGILASIGSAGPFIGLFGTVWGIMDAFLRIGKEKTASLPVVAPAIGEALIATAIGLFAAIPAVIAYNAIAKRADDLLAVVESSSAGWVALVLTKRRAAPTGAGAPR